MSADEARIIHENAYLVNEVEYVLARLQVEAGKAAAALLSAANEHIAAHGGSDTWTLAALEAVEALADLAKTRLETAAPPE